MEDDAERAIRHVPQRAHVHGFAPGGRVAARAPPQQGVHGPYRYTYRRTTIDSNSLQIQPQLIPRTAQPVRSALLSGTYIQDRRDDPTDAKRGIFNTVDLSLASGYWGSQPDFFRFFGQNSTYHRVTNKVVLARTVQLGLLAPWSDPGVLAEAALETGPFPSPDPRIPLSERFFSGGAISHRGFPFNQAGPRDPVTGFPIGGGAELLNSVELRFPLLGENIGGVLFHDAGNVFSRPSDIALRFSQRSAENADGEKVYDFDYIVQAVGFGLRYRTPIGPVRVDLGYSINPPRFIGFSGTRAELLAGQGQVREQRISHFQFHFSLGQTF
ncbi:MAG: BamA/TamA family outer membrane protein [Bryobacterales bacterium]